MASSPGSTSGSPEQPSVFKNSNHHARSFETLNVMREQHVLCDVTVRVGGKNILGEFISVKESILFVYLY